MGGYQQSTHTHAKKGIEGGMGGDLNKLFIVQIGRRDATKQQRDFLYLFEAYVDEHRDSKTTEEAKDYDTRI